MGGFSIFVVFVLRLPAYVLVAKNGVGDANYGSELWLLSNRLMTTLQITQTRENPVSIARNRRKERNAMGFK
jgi:hypothetical protein